MLPKPDLSLRDELPFLQVAKLWAREEGADIQDAAAPLASAILKGLLDADGMERDKPTLRQVRQFSRGVDADPRPPQYERVYALGDKKPAIQCKDIVKALRRAELGSSNLKGLELVSIEREKFRAWRESEGGPLPCFWFGDQRTAAPVQAAPAGDDGREQPREGSAAPDQGQTRHTPKPKDPIPKENQLHTLIQRTFEGLGRPDGNTEVWDKLMDYDTKGDEIIQEMTGEVIYWVSRHGNEQPMKRKTFNNLLAGLRNPK